MTLSACPQQGISHLHDLCLDQQLPLQQPLPQHTRAAGACPAKPTDDWGRFSEHPDSDWESSDLSSRGSQVSDSRPGSPLGLPLTGGTAPDLWSASSREVSSSSRHSRVRGASTSGRFAESIEPHDANIKLRLKALSQPRSVLVRLAIGAARPLLQVLFWALLALPLLAALAAAALLPPGLWLSLPAGCLLLLVLWAVDQTRLLDSQPPADAAAAAPQLQQQQQGEVRRKRVAVIGAGPAGLAAVKELVAAGHEVQCFERLHAVGGAWVLNDQQPCVPAYTTLSTPSAGTTFSDFPFLGPGSAAGSPDPRPASAADYLRYLQRYAERFDLLRHVSLETEVLSVGPVPGTQQWAVEVRRHGRRSRHVVDAVACCSGPAAPAAAPEVAGRSAFRGMVLPLADVKGAEIAMGKRTVVVGFGDAAAQLAHHAVRLSGRRCFLSTPSGRLVLPPADPSGSGSPSDCGSSRLRSSMPAAVRDLGAALAVRFALPAGPEAEVRSYCFRQATAGPSAAGATRSDAFVADIVAGRLALKPAIERFTETGVVFRDGSSAEADLVVFCPAPGSETAADLPYLAGLPGGDGTAADIARPDARLYRRVFHPALGPGFALLGAVQPVDGPAAPVAEMQARWLAALLSGHAWLPSRTDMEAEVARRAGKPDDLGAAAAGVDMVPYMDEIADEIGCRPRPLALARRSPVLLLKAACGPFTAAQYRLCGPGADAEVAGRFLASLPLTGQSTGYLAEAAVHFYCWCGSLLGFSQLLPCSTVL